MDFKEELRSAVDISKTVGEYVRLKKSGPQRYLGLCPFHTEKTPSFHRNVAHQYYKCFGCGEGGDVFNFVMKIEGISFYEALATAGGTQWHPHAQTFAGGRTRTPGSARPCSRCTRSRRPLPGQPEIVHGRGGPGVLVKRGLSQEPSSSLASDMRNASGRTLLRIFEQRGITPAQIGESGLVRQRDDGSFYDLFSQPASCFPSTTNPAK